jgi:hypothetical protein
MIKSETVNFENFDYWKAGKTWEQMKNNEGEDGFQLNKDKFRELRLRWPDGFYIQGWKAENEDSEPDGYMEPDETRITLDSLICEKDDLEKYFDYPEGTKPKIPFPELIQSGSAEFEGAEKGEVIIENPNELNNKDLKEIVELGISWSYLTSDARGDRDNMLAYLEDIDRDTWEQLYLKWIKD